jgi:hypothetical protein
MGIKKPQTFPEGAATPLASTPSASDWLHEIKQWYFTGSRRSANEHQPERFVACRKAEAAPQGADPDMNKPKSE